MRLVVLSPATPVPHEKEVLAAMLAAGLTRYHLRKPGTAARELATWIASLPPAWRARIVLHGHPELAAEFGLGGVHESDALSDCPSPPLAPSPLWRSRACHDLPGLHAALGRYDAVLVSPLFPSLSKPGYGPTGALPTEALADTLSRWRSARAQAPRPTEVIALGGVTADTLPPCRALGFDGVAVLGALWQAPDPVEAFHTLLAACAAPSSGSQSAGARRSPATTLAPCHA